MTAEQLDPEPLKPDLQVMTFDETAELLRISRPTLFEIIKRHEIPCRKVGRSWRFNKEVVLNWLSGNVRGSRSRRDS